MEINGIEFKEKIRYFTWYGRKSHRSSYKRVICPICDRLFLREAGIIQHLSKQTSNSDIEHAKFYLKCFPNRKDRVERWIKKHIKSVTILGEVLKK